VQRLVVLHFDEIEVVLGQVLLGHPVHAAHGADIGAERVGEAGRWCDDTHANDAHHEVLGVFL